MLGKKKKKTTNPNKTKKAHIETSHVDRKC